MELQVMIVEDNDLFLISNTKYINTVAKKYNVKLHIHSFRSVDDTLMQFIRENRIDVAFLDIEVGNRNGIVVGRELKEYNPFVANVFVSAHTELMIKANKLNMMGFLEKPINFQQLDELFYRILTAQIGKEYLDNQNAKMITFRRERKDLQLKENEIIYIKTVERKLEVITKQQRMLVSNTINSTLEQGSQILVKVSRYLIVNKKEVIAISKGKIRMSNGDILDIPFYRYKEIVSSIRS